MSKKKHDPARPDVEELKKALLAVNLQLQGAYQRFDYLCEPELIEACIFEINALKARYNYLLRCLKEQTGDSRGDRPPLSAAPLCVAAADMKGGSACLS